MADATAYVDRYIRAVGPLNEKGDLSGLAVLMAEEAIYGQIVGRSEILKAFQAQVDSGWLSHHSLGTAVGGEFLVSVYRNARRDGTSTLAAGALRFNDRAEVIELASVELAEGEPDPDVDSAAIIGRWLAAIEAFNRADLPAAVSAIAENYTGDGSDIVDGRVVVTHAADSRADFQNFLAEGRAAGWQTHQVTGIVTAGPFLAAVAHNRFADGTEGIGSYLMRVNHDGLIEAGYGLNPRELTAIRFQASG